MANQPGKLRVGLLPYLNSTVFYERMDPGAVELTEYLPRQMALAVEHGDLDAGIAYTGAGAGLISEILSVEEVFKELLEGGQTLARTLA